jgi:hypothetical protein
VKRSVKTGIKIFGIVALICSVSLFCIYYLPVILMFHRSRQQMLAGQKYMDSLTEKDFQIWVERTQKHLSNFNSAGWTAEAEVISPELKELKIVRVDKESNWVNYVWMGGFDHTALHVERLANGKFEFLAIYNDESNRVIWPKASNLKN